MARISFTKAAGGAGVVALLTAIGIVALTGGGFAYGFMNLYMLTPNLNPAEQYFGVANERWLKWLMPPGNEMYGESGTCGAQIGTFVDGTSLKECPSGCECHSTYDSIRERFNACMGNMSRHLAYTPHVDCEGKLAAYRHYEMHGFLQGATDGLVCNFVTKERFLESCEARTYYADRRDAYGWTFLVVMAVPVRAAPTVHTSRGPTRILSF